MRQLRSTFFSTDFRFLGLIRTVRGISISKWYDIFQNNVYADACMSRLVSNAYRLELDGRDMRKSSSASGK